MKAQVLGRAIVEQAARLWVPPRHKSRHLHPCDLPQAARTAGSTLDYVPFPSTFGLLTTS